MRISSGRITAFSGFIASAKKGGEAKLVQPGPLRAPVDWSLRRGFWMHQFIRASPPVGATPGSRFSIMSDLIPPFHAKYPIRARIGLRLRVPGFPRPACFTRFCGRFSGKPHTCPGLPDRRGLRSEKPASMVQLSRRFWDEGRFW
jgi:hypothetical protein